MDKIKKRIGVQPRTTDFEKVEHLFDISQKLILNQSNELFGISTIDWNTTQWMRTTLLHDRAVKLSSAKEHVYFDSVLRLGKIPEYPQSIETWKQKIEWFTKSREYRELDGINSRRARRFRVEDFPKTHNTAIASFDPMDEEENRIQVEQFKDRIIFRSMYNAIDWEKQDTNKVQR